MMRRLLLWGVPVVLVAASLYFFREAFEAYGLWRLWRETDPSGAELHQLTFHFNVTPAGLLLFAGGFLAGRWWFRRSS
ncbi:hypothetical protein [Hyphococcus sp.]|uniref:hypothetical protein n=1 Tax=Hyphococcus sp. TaxID=2038636 RepID=UPI0035C6E4E3